ncbi:MAG: radical SAM protein [Methanotrichaceae archaeon]|nr:radical SAM protein [Methanotrichaceae archaeon]
MVLICREAFNEVCVLANGNVVCSCVDANGSYILGNVKDSKIYDIFRGDSYANLRRQLISSGQDIYCPFLQLDCCFKSIPAQNMIVEETNLVIDKIRLEIISYCNLRCPSCPVPTWIKVEKHPRLDRLPIDVIREILIDTRDSLKQIWLYNYWEPFLDKRFLDILRLARELVPQAYLYTHTNGTIMPDGWIEQIVRDDLLDGISFSIDGASQESYSRYRVGGRFDIAFNNMLYFSENKRRLTRTRPDITLSRILFSKKLIVQRADNNLFVNLLDFMKTKKQFGFLRPYIVWQYILFEWNDSDEEIHRAQKLAREHGITIQWIVTHTDGKSQKYLAGSEKYQRLQGIKHYSADVLAKQVVPKNPSKASKLIK